jgi:hypothetical protein
LKWRNYYRGLNYGTDDVKKITNLIYGMQKIVLPVIKYSVVASLGSRLEASQEIGGQTEPNLIITRFLLTYWN